MTSNITTSPYTGRRIDLTPPDYYRAAKVRLAKRTAKRTGEK